ncbi:MAG: peptidylprolyl isomerase [Verrucomicrobiae bacterium]|nr:peptidylprolyl isomerase [Verrucomicrobiae bacterium]NNJ85635.1 hypothetical protein [Akkermansiaceae bacterium]
MLKMSKAFVVRMVLWSVLVVYLLCDFLVFDGPLRKEFRKMWPLTAEERIAQAKQEGICARVFNAPIYLTQVDRRVRENLWRRGRDPEKVTAREMKSLRWIALDELIAEALLRIKVRVNHDQAQVSESAVDAELARFESRFGSAEQLDKAMAAQGIESRKELRLRLQARLEQEKYVLSKIDSGIKVDDAEAKQWYDDHQKQLTMPERRRVRHIFLPTLDHPSAQAKARLQQVLVQIQSGEISFADAAKTVSEDPRSKKVGGDLGWMDKARLPGDFAAHVFAAPAKKPTLVRTKLGWHIVEVLEIRPPALLPYEIMKPEIIAAISDSRREEAVKQYKHQLRLLNHEKVEVYKDVLE